MASAIANIVGKRILKESARNHFGQEDPYFEQVPATRLNGRPSTKTKRVKKRLPPGISEHDAKILNKVKRRAYRLDLALFNLCGIRFGWGSVFGLIPIVGDVIDFLFANMVVNEAKKIDGGLPSHVLSQMYINVLLDFAIGFVPFLGDIADALYKCNTRNAVLLEKELRKRGKAKLKGQAPAVDPSLPENWDADEEELNRRHGGPPPTYERSETDSTGPALPPRTQTRTGRGWFGGGSRQRQPDVEMAQTAPPPQPPRTQSQKKLQRPARST